MIDETKNAGVGPLEKFRIYFEFYSYIIYLILFITNDFLLNLVDLIN